MACCFASVRDGTLTPPADSVRVLPGNSSAIHVTMKTNSKIMAGLLSAALLQSAGAAVNITGTTLYQQNFELFEKVLRHAPVCLPFKTVFPSVTPVCFGTMYTGALPEVHGIQFYTKPVIKIDSVYDAFIGAGKKAAIVAVRESSMSKIFLERDMDYFIEEDDEKVKETAIRLIKENKYNLLSVYTQEYDDVMHARGVLSPEAINALKNQIRIFDELANAIKETERDGKTLITFSTDHGVHNEPNGRGSHGTDEPYDLNIAHFFGVL